MDRHIIVPNIWFHRYKEVDGHMKDIEGRCKSQTPRTRGDRILIHRAVDYNSWAETDRSRKAIAGLDKDFILAEG